MGFSLRGVVDLLVEVEVASASALALAAAFLARRSAPLVVEVEDDAEVAESATRAVRRLLELVWSPKVCA